MDNDKVLSMEEQTPNPVVVALKKVWPTIYRIVNGFFYFLLSFLKNSVKNAIAQIRGGA